MNIVASQPAYHLIPMGERLSDVIITEDELTATKALERSTRELLHQLEPPPPPPEPKKEIRRRLRLTVGWEDIPQ